MGYNSGNGSYIKTNTVHLLYRDPDAPVVDFRPPELWDDEMLSWDHYSCPYNTTLPTAEFCTDLGELIASWNGYTSLPDVKQSLRFCREVRPFDLIFIQRAQPANNGLIVLLPGMKGSDYEALLKNVELKTMGHQYKRFRPVGQFPTITRTSLDNEDADSIRQIIYGPT